MSSEDEDYEEDKIDELPFAQLDDNIKMPPKCSGKNLLNISSQYVYTRKFTTISKKNMNFRQSKSINEGLNLFKNQLPSAKKILNPSKKQVKNKKNTRSIVHLDTDYEELFCAEIYKKDENESLKPKLIQKLIKVKECSILRYGLKPSIDEIEFSFCRTCDSNSMNPICAACLKICHVGHKIKRTMLKGNIKCVCGEKLHCFTKSLNIDINNENCLLAEWFITSKMSFYYKTNSENEKKKLCMLCYNFCNDDFKKNEIIKVDYNDENNILKNCECNCNKNDDVHMDRKNLFNKLYEIAEYKEHFEYFKLLHPTHIINMIFKSKKQFEYNYSDLIELVRILNVENYKNTDDYNSFVKADFASTNCYLIFRHLESFIKGNKGTDISYYCEETKKFFCVDILKKILSSLNEMKHNEKSYWLVTQKYLNLFHKIYIGNLLQTFDKYKLSDLENFTCCQRFLLFFENEKNCKESQDIVSFLISMLKNININGFNEIEAEDTITGIIKILQKFSCFYLISNGDMIRIIQEIEKTLMNMRLLRKLILKKNKDVIELNRNTTEKYNTNRMTIVDKKSLELLFFKEIKLYHIIIKLIHSFHFTFNDRLIFNILNNKEKYPTINSITPENILFAFSKTDFGRVLLKLTIRILYTVQNNFQDKSNDLYFKNTMKHGVKIMSYAIRMKENYFLSIMKCLDRVQYYEKINIININNNSDKEYIDICNEKIKLENNYEKFFNFEINLNELLNIVNQSVDNVLGEAITEFHNKSEKKIRGLGEEKTIYLIKSQYFYILSKFYQILDFELQTKKKLPIEIINTNKINEELLNTIIDKIFLFYENFIYNSSDNSLLIMSSYIFRDLCKVPDKYGLQNFELFYNCVLNLSIYDGIVSNAIVYFNNLFRYLDYLKSISYEKINDCLLYFLKIMDLFIFSIKCMDAEITVVYTKKVMKRINTLFEIPRIYFNNKAEKNGKMGEDEEINLEKSLFIYLKIVNDVYEFMYIEDREIIQKIINPSSIEFCLKYYNIDLNLRTELLRFIRKFYIDLTYNSDSRQIYANSVITNEDKLFPLKTNPLITNYQYPTKYFSFYKDFLNLSVRHLLENTDQKYASNLKETYQYQTKIKDSIQSNLMKHNSSLFSPTKERIKGKINEKVNEHNNDSSDSESSEEEEEEEEEKKIIEEKDNESSDDSDDDDAEEEEIKKNKTKVKKKRDLIPCFDEKTYDILMNELENIKLITSGIKTYSDNEMECLKNYFENGLLIPIIYFLKKSFALSHCFTGKEMVLLSKLVFECLKLRLFIAEFKYNFWKEFLDYGENSYNNKINNYNTFNINKEVEEFTKIYNKRGNSINGNFCIDNKLNQQCNSDIKLLNSKKYLCYDFTNLYDITRKNIFSLLKDRRENTFSENFIEESMNLSIKAINKEENELFPDYEKKPDFEKRIIRIYLLYKHGKRQASNENNSSLFSILPELCLEFETNYRNLLIIFLVNSGKEIEKYQDIVGETYCILCKLLSVQTTETQIDLINLLGGIKSEDLGFMTEFSENLFMKIIVLFIEVFNPTDKLLDINYVYSFILIKIFKNLCEEHNNFFQGRLIKTLNYKYKEFTPMYYNENTKENLTDDEEESYSEKNYMSKSVKFFDFFLHVASKIILVSEWDKLEFISNEELFQKQNKYLYDPFAAILEMLNEIIQGNKPEFLIKIGNPMSEVDMDDLDDELISGVGKYANKENKNSPNQKENNDDIEEKNDAFQCFVKNVSDFIFRDYLSLELLYEIRNDLMQFFTSIIEEKNCNEEMQKFIIKYLNINRVFKSISTVLKSYYLRSCDSEIIENNNNNNKNKDENVDAEKNFQFISNNNLVQIYKDQNYNDISKYQSIFDISKTRRMQTEFNTKFFGSYKRDIYRTLKEKRNRVIFNEKLLAYYRKIYFSNSEFNQTNEFILSNAFYKYIKLITVLNKSEEAKQLLEQTESMSEETAKRKFQTVNQQKNKQNLNSLKKIIKKQKILTVNKSSSKKNIKKNLNFLEIEKKNKYVNEKNPQSFDELKPHSISNIKINENLKNESKNSLKKINSNKVLPNLNEKKNFSSLLKEQNQQYDKDFIERYYIIKFFEGITSTVEVRTENSINQTVIFTQLPEMIYLSGGTKAEFEQKANRESETSKKNYLIRHVEYFQKEIKYYQNNESKLSRFISKIDFFYVQVISYFYALFLNLLLLFTLHGDTQITINSVENGSIKERRTNKKLIYDLTHKSIISRSSVMDILCNCYTGLNAILIFLWVYFRMPLYYKIDRLKFMEENNITNKKYLTFLQKLYIIFVLTIWGRDYISTLIFEFIFSFISSTFDQGEILYVALLLPIIDLNPTLKNIVVSIKLRYKELCLTFCLATIIMYVFSNFSFFFFNKDYEQELDYYDDNVCKSLVFCFLNTVDSGLRARGGIGDSAIRVSYEREAKHYIGRLFLDDLFFLLIVIISIDLVFGIIIGAFTTLRNEGQKHNNDRINHCFICHVNKNTLEKNRQNFIEHRAKTHYIWNYVDYMITLKFSDVHDLNAINSYAKEKIENKDISWLPTYKDLTNRENRRLDKDRIDNELKVDDEGANKYVIKNN